MLTSNVRDTNFFKNYLCEEWLLVNKKSDLNGGLR